MSLYNQDATLYNRWIDPTTRLEKWQRTQITGVHFEGRKGVAVIRYGGYIEDDKAYLYIPFTRGANYLEPIAWQALAVKTGKWTLQLADFVFKGLITDDPADAYTDPITHWLVPAVTMSTLAAKYDDVFTISSVDTNDQGSVAMHHWQLGLG
jgi:hypothetical protein